MTHVFVRSLFRSPDLLDPLMRVQNNYYEPTLKTKNFGHLYFGHFNFGQNLSAKSPKGLYRAGSLHC